MFDRLATNPAVIRSLVIIGIAAGLLAVVSAVQIARSQPPSFHGTAYPDAPPAPDFTLVDHTGQPVTLSKYADRPLLLFFGFTRCPDICPLTLTKLSRVLDDADLGDERPTIVLVSVDPEYDTPGRLAEYVGSFPPGIVGLTGDPETVEAVLGEYGVYAEPVTSHDGHETIAHTSIVFGIDRNGRLQVLMHPDEPDDVLASDIRTLVRIAG